MRDGKLTSGCLCLCIPSFLTFSLVAGTSHNSSVITNPPLIDSQDQDMPEQQHTDLVEVNSGEEELEQTIDGLINGATDDLNSTVAQWSMNQPLLTVNTNAPVDTTTAPEAPMSLTERVKSGMKTISRQILVAVTPKDGVILGTIVEGSSRKSSRLDRLADKNYS